ncbi:MAG: hypothetical protein ABJZ83_05230 [Yoonia sp.]|uniref:hypothetical protein n=1 Tax=Paracoccaceae TaxID=31989 RepID=UPI003267143E
MNEIDDRASCSRIPLKFDFNYQCILEAGETDSESYEFSTEWDLLLELSGPLLDDRGTFQNYISRALDDCPICASWTKRRTPITEASHFTKYQETDYDLYHRSARSVLQNLKTTSALDGERYAGLCEEIAGSGVRVSKGQLLFHGRAIGKEGREFHETKFLSTSLDPVVAINSSLRRAFDPERLEEDKNRSKEVLMIELEKDRLAIWGQYEGSFEREVLLCPPYTFEEVAKERIGEITLMHVLLKD